MKTCIGDYYILEILQDRAVVYSWSKWKKGTPLRPFMKENWYPSVRLIINGKVKHRYMHQLVADAIYGPCPDGMQVNHKDGNKLNYAPSNLEYVTPSENSQHAYDTHLHIQPRGPDHWAYKDGRCHDMKAYKNWHQRMRWAKDPEKCRQKQREYIAKRRAEGKSC